MDRVKQFSGEYSFLSNFYPSSIQIKNIVAPTAEHAYQAFKATNKQDFMRIISLETPGQAKRAGKKILMRSDWENVKVSLMQRVVERKFKTHLDLMRMLISTGDATLEEGNWWGDRFWGVDSNTREGRNVLGKILMQIRTNQIMEQYLNE